MGASALYREGELRLVSMDDYGHLRRIVATVRDWPRVPSFDPYLRHPHGAVWIWPPGFDLALATPARLLLGADADPQAVARLLAFVPPLLGALAVFPLFLFARRLAGEWAGLVAAGAWAVLPGAVRWSGYAHLDQHTAEALLFLVLLAAGSRLLEGEGGRGVAGTALTLAAGTLVWQGFVFTAALLGLAAWIERRRAPAVAVALGAAALLVLPVSLLQQSPATFASFGLFQPAVFLLVGAMAAALMLPGWAGLGVAAALGTGALAFWTPLRSAAVHLASGGEGTLAETGYLAYPGDWLRLIGEYRPLASLGWSGVLAQLSVGILLLPAVAVVLVLARRRGRVGGSGTVWLVSTAAVAAMTLSQRRYLYYLVGLVAVALGLTAVWLARRWGAGVAAVAIVVCLAPTVPAWPELGRPSGAVGVDVLQTLDALRAMDPPPGSPFEPDLVAPGEIPGVLAPWSLGHVVTYVTGRPIVAGNFGYGFREQSLVFTAPPEADGETEALLRDLGVRYVITTDLRSVLPEYAEAVGRAGLPVDRMLAVRIHESFEPRAVPFLEPILISRTGLPNENGMLVPRLRVFRLTPEP